MTAESKIQWTNYTWNPWHGCKKVSEGCKFCYMYRDKERYGQDPTKVIRASKNTFNKPLHIKEESFVFTCSWSDFFIEEADEWRDEAWDIIRRTPHLTYQILTKRPQNIIERLPSDWGEGYDNVWLGVSGENEFLTHQRLLTLRNVDAKVRFLSAEPLIESIHSSRNIQLIERFVDWIIIGGESGNDTGKYKYRPCKLDWIEMLLANIRKPVFVKQLGTYLAKELRLKDRHGGNIDEFPENLRIRQYPN